MEVATSERLRRSCFSLFFLRKISFGPGVRASWTISSFIMSSLDIKSVPSEFPRLDIAVEEEWRVFVIAYNRYVKLGGPLHISSFINEFALETLYSLLRIDGFEIPKESDKFVAAVNLLYAPKDKIEASDRFKSLKLAERSVRGVVLHVQSFKALMKDCGKFCPMESRLIDFFMSSLSHKRFVEILDANEPKDLDQLLAYAVKFAGSVFPAVENVSLRVPVVASVVVCHGCGKEGHYRSTCPDRKPSSNGPAANTRSQNKQQQVVKTVRSEPSVPPRVDVEVADKKMVVALLDSGSMTNMVGPALARNLIAHGAPVTVVNEKFYTVDDSPVEVSQRVEVEFTVRRLYTPSFSYKISCAVVDCGEDLLIGYPDMVAHKMLHLLKLPDGPLRSRSDKPVVDTGTSTSSVNIVRTASSSSDDFG